MQASDASLSALIEAMSGRLSRRQLQDLLKSGGAELATRFEAGAGKTLRARVQNAPRLLNALGGSAKVEKEESGFCIRSQGCPCPCRRRTSRDLSSRGKFARACDQRRRARTSRPRQTIAMPFLCFRE